MKVRNMESARGNMVPNQFIIEGVDEQDNWCEYFQSYKSVIAKKAHHKDTGELQVYLDVNKWDYSVITGKYRNEFLGEKKSRTEKKIASGEYVLVDLN